MNEESQTPDPVQECNKEIRAALDKYACIITVPELNIETGRIFPIVKVKLRPKPQEPSTITNPS